MSRICGKSRGFTLIEAIASCLILATGAMVVCGLARQSIERNQRGIWYEQGHRLLDECLDSAVAKKEDILAKREVRGDFDGRYPGYNYILEIEQAQTAGLYLVKAKVTWKIIGQEHSARGETLIYAN
ncbi:MAG: hypothetical protein GY799_30450 [Desulfobulbaceae bacterium]|nr:hypothetical protein [Desulfobulbaceae bacterium]